jgi:hypothetical protein
MIDSFVTIDSNRGGGLYEIYPCKLDPFHRWNEFAVPRFSPRVFRQILEDFGYELVTAVETRGVITDGWGCRHHVGYELRDNATYWYFEGWCWSWINDRREKTRRYEICVRIRDREFRGREQVYEYELPVSNIPKMATEERLTLIKGIARAVALRVVSELKLEGDLQQRGYEFEVGSDQRMYVRFKGTRARTIQEIEAELMTGVEVHDLILEEGRERVGEAIDYLDRCRSERPAPPAVV